jgi:hypothetical protein
LVVVAGLVLLVRDRFLASRPIPTGERKSSAHQRERACVPGQDPAAGLRHGGSDVVQAGAVVQRWCPSQFASYSVGPAPERLMTTVP